MGVAVGLQSCDIIGCPQPLDAIPVGVYDAAPETLDDALDVAWLEVEVTLSQAIVSYQQTGGDNVVTVTYDRVTRSAKDTGP